jgi:hypothetical protein
MKHAGILILGLAIGLVFGFLLWHSPEIQTDEALVRSRGGETIWPDVPCPTDPEQRTARVLLDLILESCAQAPPEFRDRITIGVLRCMHEHPVGPQHQPEICTAPGGPCENVVNAHQTIEGPDKNWEGCAQGLEHDP